MKAFVINLERRKDRLQYINENYKNDKYDLEIVKAYDGKYEANNNSELINLKNDFLFNLKRNSINNNYNYKSFNPFKPGELGCFLSHLFIWKKIISEKENAIIYEDDCIFNNDFSTKISLVLNEIPDNFNIIWLGGTKEVNHSSNEDVKITNNISIKKNQTTLGTFAYIISFQCAKLLVNYAYNTFKGNLGVDFFMDEFLTKNNHIQHIVSPCICYSTINNTCDNIFKSDTGNT